MNKAIDLGKYKRNTGIKAGAIRDKQRAEGSGETRSFHTGLIDHKTRVAYIISHGWPTLFAPRPRVHLDHLHLDNLNLPTLFLVVELPHLGEPRPTSSLLDLSH